MDGRLMRLREQCLLSSFIDQFAAKNTNSSAGADSQATEYEAQVRDWMEETRGELSDVPAIEDADAESGTWRPH